LTVKAQTVQSPPPPPPPSPPATPPPVLHDWWWVWLIVMTVTFVCVIYCMLAMLTLDDSSDKYNDPMVPPTGEPLGRRIRRQLGLKAGAATPGGAHLGLKLDRLADGMVQRSDF
jgi:hypothetical protein